MTRFEQLCLVGSFSAALFCGCKVFQGAKSARLTTFECEANALRPALGDIMDVEALLRDLYAGKASLSAVISNAKLTEDETKALLSALQACQGPPPQPTSTTAS